MTKKSRNKKELGSGETDGQKALPNIDSENSCHVLPTATTEYSILWNFALRNKQAESIYQVVSEETCLNTLIGEVPAQPANDIIYQ